MTLNDMLDLVKSKQSLSSERALARALNHSGNLPVRNMRKGHSLPSDETMIKICELAEIDIEVGLAWLNIWRSKEATTRKYYKNILDTLTKQASVFVIAIFIIATNNINYVEAKTIREQTSIDNIYSINCANFFCKSNLETRLLKLYRFLQRIVFVHHLSPAL